MVCNGEMTLRMVIEIGSIR